MFLTKDVFCIVHQLPLLEERTPVSMIEIISLKIAFLTFCSPEYFPPGWPKKARQIVAGSCES
jgi:hypothetical protein